MATAVASQVSSFRCQVSGPAGLYFPQAQAGGVCGWVFLAWLSKAWNQTQAECFVLGQEARGEQGAGPAGDAAAAGGGLAGGAGVGA